MKAIMVMFDSLNRGMLQTYGCDWVPTPNFERLAARSVTFDTHYVCSMPCMPARRELHTGRPNFEHRSWGPLEPYDDSMPEILHRSGVLTCLATDHYHYWEDGGCTYHNRYSCYEFSRGQEGDHWKTSPELFQAVHERRTGGRPNYWDVANRKYLDREEKMPQAVTFRAGLDFIRQHHAEDRFFLQIETFDPHEPFFTRPEWKVPFRHEYSGEIGDWPPYYCVTEGDGAVDHIKKEYAALVTMCDHYLGKVLDLMDEYNLWRDTLLIVNTDHGFLLGEHGWWCKTLMPVYEEISHIPLFIHDPRFPEQDGSRRAHLTQTIDLAPTILEFFDQPLPNSMTGHPLGTVIEKNIPIRDYAIFGYHGGHCHITDGQWVYMKAPLENTELYDYTLMPTHMRSLFTPDELRDAELAGPFSFTKGCKVLKIQAQECANPPANFGTKLFYLPDDPKQTNPINNLRKETELANAMLRLMREDDCPKERFARFGFPEIGEITEEDIRSLRETERSERIPVRRSRLCWDRSAGNMYMAVKRLVGDLETERFEAGLRSLAVDGRVTETVMRQWICSCLPKEDLPRILYFAVMAARTE